MEAALTKSIAEAAALLHRPVAPAVGTSDGAWHRSPAHVLGEALQMLLLTDPNGVRRWCTWTLEGASWLERQRLVYPQLQRDPTLLWTHTSGAARPHGRPAGDWRALDEWTRVEPAVDMTRGQVGDYGGDAQVAGLYWNMGDEEDVALTLFDIQRAVGTVGAAAAAI